ncbi:KDO2-lipid IV(A) lauroyltransferase [Inhella inkyongensis]|uniref:KDO2-lipid IV(A) lauroyltransferase n=1 Tax=Inhella inkyongensis TaxID=392593 RepID=A0A840SAR7_9BURK|nr:KDO2-lipid IV(A) lauroyltransferase [Inhella inkyongensis]
MALRSYARVCMGVLDSLFLKELRVDIAYEDAGARQALTQGERACVSTLHMGCYETVALALQRLTGRCTTLAKLPPGLPSIATRLRASGIRYLDRTEGNQLFELVAALRKGGFVCLHADHQGRDIEVRFLGQTTKAPVGCALVAALGGAPLLLGHAQMLAAGHYRVSFSTLSTQAPGRDLASLKRQVRRCYRRFDALVRAHPEHYYWSYARFRPRAEPQAGPPQSKPAAFSQEPVRSWRGAL